MRKAYLVGRLDITKSPPTMVEVGIKSSPAEMLSGMAGELYVNLLPHGFGKDYETGRNEILSYLIQFQDYYRWMEPLMDVHLVVHALVLQEVPARGVGLALLDMRYEEVRR